MRSRCQTKSHQQYKYYGGRGITVCKKWQSFEGFLEDMGARPPGLSIDRINNDKGYCLKNCRWADRETQQNNTRATHKIEFNGETLSISQWSRKLKISRNRIRSRLQRGMTVEESLTWPAKERKFCRQGHLLSDNLKITKKTGARQCRICRNNYKRDWYYKKK